MKQECLGGNIPYFYNPVEGVGDNGITKMILLYYREEISLRFWVRIMSEGWLTKTYIEKHSFQLSMLS